MHASRSNPFCFCNVACCSLVLLFLAPQAFGQAQTKRGAVIGGLTGAAIGAVIGDNSDEAGAGAAIGGVVGVVAGSVLGSANQEQYGNAGRRGYGYGVPSYRQTYPVVSVPARTVVVAGVSVDDVITMTQNQVSDSVIISEIASKGVGRDLTVQDIVYLSRQGVSDSVIQTMQNAARTARPVQARNTPPSTVIVERRSSYPAYPIPVYPPSQIYHHHHHHGPGNYYRPTTVCRPRSGVNVIYSSR